MDNLENYTNAQLLLKIRELEERIGKLEEGTLGKGYYLEGTPDYVREYAKSKKLIGDENE